MSKYKGCRLALKDVLFDAFLAEFVRSDGDQIVDTLLLRAITICELTDQMGNTLIDEISKSCDKYARPKTVRALGVILKHFKQNNQKQQDELVNRIKGEEQTKTNQSFDFASNKASISVINSEIKDIEHRLKVMEQLKDEKYELWTDFPDSAVSWQPQDEDYSAIMYRMCQICSEFRCNAKAYPCGHIPVCAVCRYEHGTSPPNDRTICPHRDCGKTVTEWKIVSQLWDDEKLWSLY